MPINPPISPRSEEVASGPSLKINGDLKSARKEWMQEYRTDDRHRENLLPVYVGGNCLLGKFLCSHKSDAEVTIEPTSS